MASSSLAIPPCAVEAKGMTSEVNIKPPNFTQGIYQSIGKGYRFVNKGTNDNPSQVIRSFTTIYRLLIQLKGHSPMLCGK
jgi:hypothetical protein